MLLFRKFPDIRKSKLCIRKYVAIPILSVLARPSNAHNFEIQEIVTDPGGISVNW